MAEEIKFYGRRLPHFNFSNFARWPIVVDGKEWHTSEHYYQSMKFAGTKYEEMVREAKTPAAAARIGRKKNLPLREDWEDVKIEIMYKAVRAKFKQHGELRLELLDTGDATIIEHTVNDSYWGDGGDGSGKNMLGMVLMTVRDELQKEQAQEIKLKEI